MRCLQVFGRGTPILIPGLCLLVCLAGGSVLAATDPPPGTTQEAQRVDTADPPRPRVWARVRNGETSLETVLQRQLKKLAGEADDGALGTAQVLSDGEAETLLMEAHRYLQAGPDAATRAEIRRLLDRMGPDLDAIVEAAVPGRHGPGGDADVPMIDRFVSTLSLSPLPAARAADDCSAMWGDNWPRPDPVTGACALAYHWPASNPVNTLYYPGQWGEPGHESLLAYLDLIAGHADDSQAYYRRHGATDNLRIFLGVPDQGVPHAQAIPSRGTGECQVTIFARTLLATPREHVAFIVAHELFHCFTFRNMGEAFWGNPLSVNGWWVEGGASYFADRVFPDSDIEFVKYFGEFDRRSPTDALVEMSYETIHFFQFLGGIVGEAQIIAWLQALPAGGGLEAQARALSTWDDIDRSFHAFGRAYLASELHDAAGKRYPHRPLPGRRIAVTPPVLELETRPFVLSRFQLAFDPDQSLTLGRPQIRPATGRHSVRVTPPTADTPWTTPLPARMPGVCGHHDDLQLLLTSTGPGPETRRLRVALGGAPDDASSATAAADGVDHCLVGQWQPRAGAVEALQQKMLEAPDLFARVERSVRDTGTLCLDETGRVDEQVRLDPSTTRLVTRDGTDLTISGPLRADSKGWYHVRDGGIRFLGQARIEDRATRATVNGRDLGTGTNPSQARVPDPGRFPSQEAFFACLKRGGDCSSPVPTGPDTRPSHLIPPTRAYRCSGNTLQLALPDPYGHLWLAYDRKGDASPRYDGRSVTGGLDDATPAPDPGARAECRAIRQEMDRLASGLNSASGGTEAPARQAPQCQPQLGPGRPPESDPCFQAMQAFIAGARQRLARSSSVHDQLEQLSARYRAQQCAVEATR